MVGMALLVRCVCDEGGASGWLLAAEGAWQDQLGRGNVLGGLLCVLVAHTRRRASMVDHGRPATTQENR